MVLDISEVQSIKVKLSVEKSVPEDEWDKLPRVAGLSATSFRKQPRIQLQATNPQSNVADLAPIHPTNAPISCKGAWYQKH